VISNITPAAFIDSSITSFINKFFEFGLMKNVAANPSNNTMEGSPIKNRMALHKFSSTDPLYIIKTDFIAIKIIGKKLVETKGMVLVMS